MLFVKLTSGTRVQLTITQSASTVLQQGSAEVVAVRVISMPQPPAVPAGPPPPAAPRQQRRLPGAKQGGQHTAALSRNELLYGARDPGVILRPGPPPARVVTDMSALFIILDLCGKGGGPAVTETALSSLLFDGLTPLSDYVATCSYGKAKLDRTNSRIVTIRLPCQGIGSFTKR